MEIPANTEADRAIIGQFARFMTGRTALREERLKRLAPARQKIVTSSEALRASNDELLTSLRDDPDVAMDKLGDVVRASRHVETAREGYLRSLQDFETFVGPYRDVHKEALNSLITALRDAYNEQEPAQDASGGGDDAPALLEGGGTTGEGRMDPRHEGEAIHRDDCASSGGDEPRGADGDGDGTTAEGDTDPHHEDEAIHPDDRASSGGNEPEGADGDVRTPAAVEKTHQIAHSEAEEVPPASTRGRLAKEKTPGKAVRKRAAPGAASKSSAKGSRGDLTCHKCHHTFKVPAKLKAHLARKRPCDVPGTTCRYCSQKFPHQPDCSKHENHACTKRPGAAEAAGAASASGPVSAGARKGGRQAKAAQPTAKKRRLTEPEKLAEQNATFYGPWPAAGAANVVGNTPSSDPSGTPSGANNVPDEGGAAGAASTIRTNPSPDADDNPSGVVAFRVEASRTQGTSANLDGVMPAALPWEAFGIHEPSEGR